MRKGILYALGAYGAWGLLPMYWKALQHVPALEILAHRIVWALGVILLLLTARGQWRWLRAASRDRRILGTFAASGLLLTFNWFVYIWAVNAGHVLETSLGYFINPLVNVLLGVLFLGERLRPWQGLAIVIALTGVVYMTISFGVPPWIALALAGSFGVYGLLRKTATLNSLEGLTVETLMIFLPALAYLLYLEQAGRGVFGHTDLQTTILLVVTGLVTAGPLLLFAAGARRITLASLGVLQYMAPSIQFLLGVFLYKEPLTPARLVGFACIWLALVIYTLEGVARNRQAARSSAAGQKA